MGGLSRKEKGCGEIESEKKGYHVGLELLVLKLKKTNQKHRSFSLQSVKNMIVDPNIQTTVPPLTMVFTRVN